LSDETQVETKVEPIVAAATVAAAAKPEAAPKQASQPSRPLDKLALRRLEMKKQKRKAHRHKINASNTPG
jgi:phage tail sheath gpL-like